MAFATFRQHGATSFRPTVLRCVTAVGPHPVSIARNGVCAVPATRGDHGEPTLPELRSLRDGRGATPGVHSEKWHLRRSGNTGRPRSGLRCVTAVGTHPVFTAKNGILRRSGNTGRPRSGLRCVTAVGTHPVSTAKNGVCAVPATRGDHGEPTLPELRSLRDGRGDTPGVHSEKWHLRRSGNTGRPRSGLRCVTAVGTHPVSTAKNGICAVPATRGDHVPAYGARRPWGHTRCPQRKMAFAPFRQHGATTFRPSVRNAG